MRLLLLLALASAPVFADEKSARAAFDEIRAQMDAFDPAVAWRYAPNAKITTLRDGQQRLEIDGAQYASLIASSMAAAKARNDRSTFSDVIVTAADGRWRISAKRYSHLRCHLDAGYTMDLALIEGEWKIVAEHSETRSASQCAGALTDVLAAAEMAIMKELPIEIDADTRLHAVKVDGSALVHRLLLHTVGRGDLDRGQFSTAMRENLKVSSCADPGSVQLLRSGATLRYQYQNRDGDEMATIDLVAADCGA